MEKSTGIPFKDIDEVLCEECEEPIPHARLVVSPGAELCVECQEVAEKAGRFQRHLMTQKVEYSRDGSEVESITNVLVRSKS